MILLSNGGGVQTSYMILRNYKRYQDPHKARVVMADVGAGDRDHAEYSLTYWILDNIIKPFCIEKNIKFDIRDDGESLWDLSMRKKMIPVRFPRWCTDKKKKRVIRRYMTKEMKAVRPTKKNPKGNIITLDIGFSFDEVKRLKVDLEEPHYVKSNYPLLDSKTSRQDCINWLNDNYPIIMNGNKIDWKEAKSGCWFCMFAKRSQLKQLTPFQQEEIKKFEQNGARYPEIMLKDNPIETYFKDDKQKTFDNEESCDEGYCFV